MAMSSPLVHLDGQCRVIANGATRGLDNPACVKLDYAAAWYSWMIPPSTSRRPMSLSDRRAEVTSLSGAGLGVEGRGEADAGCNAGRNREGRLRDGDRRERASSRGILPVRSVPSAPRSRSRLAT